MQTEQVCSKSCSLDLFFFPPRPIYSKKNRLCACIRCAFLIPKHFWICSVVILHKTCMDMGTKWYIKILFYVSQWLLGNVKRVSPRPEPRAEVWLGCSSGKSTQVQKRFLQKNSSEFDHDEIGPCLGMKQRWYEKEWLFLQILWQRSG